ncbi:MAG: DNA polymerase III subunit gamma/tau [Candidatus Woesearchaeota archaeon]
MDFANKYRPRKLSDIIGQPNIVTTLSNAIEYNQLHHAYLFWGSKGTGKTSMARILAAMVNCVNGPTSNPCGICEQCKLIFSGHHSDVEEIDAASGGKIDEVRELKKNAYYAPVASARKKFYIIDECHSLSPAGAEGLLKLIEEPPPHLCFVLCTTELQKMTSTIISRCQSHGFQKIYWTQLVQRLNEVAKAENLNVDDQAIKLCAMLSGGSMRDALQYLNKLASYSGKETISAEMARNLFGVVNDDVYHRLVSSIIGDNGKPNPAEGYKIINDIFISGINIKTFLSGLDEHLRYLFIALTSPKTIERLVLTEEDKKRITIEASRFDIVKINQIMDYLSEIYRCLNYGINPERLLDQWFANSILFCHLKGKETK